jgi:hypothetical protein
MPSSLTLDLTDSARRTLCDARKRHDKPHVRDRNEAKFWLDPVRLERSGGFPRHELREIRRLLETHEQDLLDAWNAYS